MNGLDPDWQIGLNWIRQVLRRNGLGAKANCIGLLLAPAEGASLQSLWWWWWIQTWQRRPLGTSRCTGWVGTLHWCTGCQWVVVHCTTLLHCCYWVGGHTRPRAGAATHFLIPQNQLLSPQYTILYQSQVDEHPNRNFIPTQYCFRPNQLIQPKKIPKLLQPTSFWFKLAPVLMSKSLHSSETNEIPLKSSVA